MNNMWMIDALKDLRQVAHAHAMLNLAEQLDDVIIVAATELRACSGDSGTDEGHDNKNRGVARPD